jgi:arsenite methyltransferase
MTSFSSHVDPERAVFSREPYASHVELIEPRVAVPAQQAPPFPCAAGMFRRDPRQTKGQDYRETSEPAPTGCGPNDGSCC